MTSQLNVDTIKGQTAETSITIQGEGSATTNLQQGLCKSWVNFSSVTSTAVTDSFNISGLTDNGSGNTTFAISNNMSNSNWSGTYFQNANASDTFSNDFVGGFNSRTTSGATMQSHNQSGGLDCLLNDIHLMGDLA